MNILEYDGFLELYFSPSLISAASILLIQAHPVTPYVCRSLTANITLRCQYGMNVTRVLWRIGALRNLENPSTIPGHTALPHTTTYQELVVDRYANLRGEYHCTAVIENGTRAGSNIYVPVIECEFEMHGYIMCVYNSTS